MFAVPLSLLTFFLVTELNQRVAFSVREQLGIEYLGHLQKLASDLRDHRGLTWSQSKRPDGAAETGKVEKRLRDDMDSIDATDRKLGATFQTTAMWSAFRAKYQALEGSSNDADPADPRNHHTALIADVIALMSQVADQSNLTLDPELDTFYLMDLMVVRLPLLTEQIGQSRGFGSGLTDNAGDFELIQFRLRNHSSEITTQLKTLDHHFKIAARETHDPELARSLEPAVNRSTVATSEYLRTVAGGTSSGAIVEGFAADVWKQGSSTLRELETLNSQVSLSLDKLLQARISRLKGRRIFFCAVTFSCTLLVVYLFTSFYLAVMRTVAQLDAASVRLLASPSGDVQVSVDTQDELGQITRSFGSLATRLKTESLALRNSQQRMWSILNGAVDGVITIDDQGRIESVNPAVERLFGHKPEGLVGNNVRMLMPEPFRGEHDGYLRRYLTTGEKRIIGMGREVQALRKDGSVFFADLTISEVQLHDCRIFTGFVRDITLRKQAEGVLAERTRLAELTANVGVALTKGGTLRAILQGCCEAIVHHLDAAFTRVWTISESGEFLELQASAGLKVALDGPYDRLPVGQLRIGLIAQEQQPHLTNQVLDDPCVSDQEWARREGMVSFAGHPLVVDKRLVGVMALFARHPLSPATVGALAAIADGIALGIERCVVQHALERALAEARRASQAKGEFLANMSHEIRTPMNGIIGMTDLALSTSLTMEQREYLDTVKTSADSLLRIINDILDFSKIDAGKLELDPRPFRLRDSLGDTMKTLAIRAHEKHLELLWHTAPEVPDDLIGDIGRLRQVLVNMTGNAIKFTERGEVDVSVRLVSCGDESARLRFSVRDTGIGIPKEKQALIFESFAQVDASTTRLYGGTGLGLSISRQLVHLMGGHLSLESAPGEGSTFSFEIDLPLAHESAIDLERFGDIDLAGVRVLVVDDNQTNRRILDEILKNWKMLPALAESGPAALEQLRQASQKGESFDLILTDCHMPEMDGFMFVEELKKHPNLARSTIMMLTSADRQGAYDRCRRLGISAILLKPLKQSELQQSIIESLGRADRSQRRTAPSADSLAESGPSLNILLAEDNQTNQLVAIGLLKKLGHTVQIAENGQLVLDALQNNQFDVVLMDVQMPVMDGLSAVKAIRDLEKNTDRHQPVIAMTAHAMSGDRQRCLDAGMDDYISKPINREAVVAALARIIEGSGSADSLPLDLAAGTRDTARSSEHLPQCPAFDLEAALARLGGDTDFLREIIELFLDVTPAIMESLHAAVERRDSNAASEAAHSIKGSVASLSALSCYDSALNLEQICRNGNMGELQSSHQVLVFEANRLFGDLRIYLQESR